MSEKLSVKKRIVLISNEIRIGKDGKNKFSDYNYFKPDDINNALNPLLEKYNLITIFTLKNNGEYYTAGLTIEDTDSEDRVLYQFDIAKAVVKGANEAQNSGATLTYAKRYSLMNAFNLADNEDDFDSDKMNSKNKDDDKKKKAEELNNIISEIDNACKSLGDSKEVKEKMVVAIKTVKDAPINYKSIKSIQLAKQVLEAIKNIK